MFGGKYKIISSTCNLGWVLLPAVWWGGIILNYLKSLMSSFSNGDTRNWPSHRKFTWIKWDYVHEQHHAYLEISIFILAFMAGFWVSSEVNFRIVNIQMYLCGFFESFQSPTFIYFYWTLKWLKSLLYNVGYVLLLLLYYIIYFYYI